MANFALTVLRMTGYMLMMVLMTAVTFIVLMLPMPVMMLLVPAATLIVIMLFMLMMMMLVTAAAFIVIMLFMRSVVIATAAVIMMLCGMLVRMAAAITMAMLRDMPHAGMIMVLATVTTGAAFGMVTIIFIPLNMAVHMSKAAHLLGGITHFFQIPNCFFIIFHF